MRWVFTADEFAHVWRETGLDRFPSPLAIRTSARTKDAAAQVGTMVAGKFPVKADPDLSAALTVVAQPSTQVGILAKSIRASGSVMHEIAVSIVQHRAAIELHVCRRDELGAVLAAAIPAAEPGSLSEMASAHSEFAGIGTRSLLTDPARRSSTGPMRAVLGAARVDTGHVCLRRELDTEYPAPPQCFSWIDVVGDGRYLIRTGPDIVIRPAQAETIRAELELLLD